MTYGQELFDSAKQHLPDKLDSIHHQALKKKTPANQAPPAADALCVLTQIPPLSIGRKTAQLKYWSRTMIQHNNLVKDIFEQ